MSLRSESSLIYTTYVLYALCLISFLLPLYYLLLSSFIHRRLIIRRPPLRSSSSLSSLHPATANYVLAAPLHLYHQQRTIIPSTKHFIQLIRTIRLRLITIIQLLLQVYTDLAILCITEARPVIIIKLLLVLSPPCSPS